MGYDQSSQDSTETDKNVLRHYDFAKGLLGSFVSLDSPSKSRDAFLLVDSPRQSFLRCQKETVSVLFWSAAHSVAQYVVLNTSTGKLDRWKINAPFDEPRANGFASTDDGQAFVSLDGFRDSDHTVSLGLFELQATSGNSVATPIPVAGTVTAYSYNHALPDGTFLDLYGAEGDELVVQRIAYDSSLSWAKVTTSAADPGLSTLTGH